MGQLPRRNEDRFYRYPMRRVVAIIDDDPGVEAALQNLRQAGVDVGAVNVLSGPEGARLLDRTGTGHGLRARLLRLLQRGAYESEALQAHETALTNGHHVIYVPVSNDDERANVVEILSAAGGHHRLFFGRWGIEEIRF
jgi:hypothetical protein